MLRFWHSSEFKDSLKAATDYIAGYRTTWINRLFRDEILSGSLRRFPAPMRDFPNYPGYVSLQNILIGMQHDLLKGCDIVPNIPLNDPLVGDCPITVEITNRLSQADANSLRDGNIILWQLREVIPPPDNRPDLKYKFIGTTKTIVNFEFTKWFRRYLTWLPRAVSLYRTGVGVDAILPLIMGIGAAFICASNLLTLSPGQGTINSAPGIANSPKTGTPPAPPANAAPATSGTPNIPAVHSSK
jgi:hypothetical protein